MPPTKWEINNINHEYELIDHWDGAVGRIIKE